MTSGCSCRSTRRSRAIRRFATSCPTPRRAELLTRWDMICDPPDVLVTNYSMLNVMLMRRLEDPIFEQTRAWLEFDPANVFTLVVDELHLYRGTQGSEVALIVRNLLMRLGLAPDSPQLRVIGTSASLEGDRSDYLERFFFGVPRSTFKQISGETRPVMASLPFPAPDLGSTDAPMMTHVLAEACRDEDGAVRATDLPTIATRAFGPDGSVEDVEKALEIIAGSSDEGRIPFRAHYFMRTMRGMWACSNLRARRSRRASHVNGPASGVCSHGPCTSARAAGGSWS